jgi:hypothetical protein
MGANWLYKLGANPFKAQAESFLAPAGRDVIRRNRIITGKYAEMYRKDPDVYVYFGLAAIASANVGKAMKVAKDFEKRIRNASEIYNTLAEGNLAIYRDIFWTGLAFEKGGRTMKVLNTLEGVPPLVKSGWMQIAAGKVLQGTLSLVREEQDFVLQPIFGNDPKSVRRQALRESTWYLAVDPKQMLFPGMTRFPLGDYGDRATRFAWTQQVTRDWFVYQKENQTAVVKIMDALIADGKRAAAGN